MDEREFLRSNMNKWRRKIINGCWVGVALFLAAQLATIPFLKELTVEEFLRTSVMPSMTLAVAVMGICEMSVRYALRAREYILMCGACVVAAVIVWHQTIVSTILIVFLFPPVISLIYFDRRITIFSLALCEILFLCLYAWNPVWHVRLLPFDLIAFAALLMGVTFIMMQVLTRGWQFIEFFRVTSDSNVILKAENVAMKQMTKLDGLTGIYNHVAFHDYLHHLMEYIHRMPIPPCLAIIDIDNFKIVNDTFGHHAGDAALRSVANIIQRSLAPNDVASRYGGEEFAVIMLEKSAKSVAETLERIRLTIASTKLPEIGDRAVTVSIGMAPYTDSLSKSEWFRAADARLCEAKKTGKNKLVRESA